MTQEYKDYILDYLTGNKTDTTMVDEPILEETQTINNNIRDYIQNIEGVGGTVWAYGGIIQPGNSNKLLIYGNTSDGNDGYVTYLIVMDENFNILGHTTTYESGTSLKYLAYLSFDETNKLFGVDDPAKVSTSSTTPTYRFIMLDNPIMNYELNGEVSVKLRRSYYFPTTYNSNQLGSGRDFIKKNPNGSQYLISTYKMSGNTDFIFEYILLEINVGSANTWNNYDAGVEVYDYSGLKCVYTSWSNSNLLAKAYWGEYIFILNNEVVTTVEPIPSSLGNYTGANIIALNEDVAYYSMLIYSSDYSTLTTKIYKYDGTNFTEIKDFGAYSIVGIPAQALSFAYKDGMVFYNRYVKTLYDTYYYADVYIGMIYNDEVYEIKLNDSIVILTGLSIPLVQHNYNLWKITYMNETNCYPAQMIFNSDNYNGEAGISVQSGVPHSMRLYAEDGIVFARNLYNMRINANTITSILEVPNTYLNNTTITNEDLYSVNNNILDQQTETINTNIYETLYINTNDTWNMINNNDPLEPLTNKVGATRLVNSTAQQLDYDNAKAGVFRVVTSGGYYDRYINPSDISYDDGVYTYSFNFYGNPSINQIQILSYDKETIYCTYDVSTESGKTYTYTQEVTIE